MGAEIVHLANCPLSRNEPGACLGCDELASGDGVAEYRPKPRKPYSPAKRAYYANYFRDRRMKAKRIAGEDLRYDSLDHLPPIEVDNCGFARKPPTPPDAWKYNFTLEQRKVRFLLYWNYAGGNWTVAAQFAGVPREMAEAWFRPTSETYDRRMPPLLDRCKHEIADRLRLRMLQVAGLVRMPPDVVVNTTALMFVVKEYGLELPPEAPGAILPSAVAAEKPTIPSAPVPESLGGIPRPGNA